MADIKTVASLAGVSPSTVSNVFTQKKFVSEDTKNRVLKVCSDLNYRPSVMASSIITKSTNIIGFFDLGFERYDDIYSDMIKGVTMQAATYDKRVLLYMNIKDANELRSSLRFGCQPVDGAILPLPREEDLRVNNLTIQTIPYVLIGSPYKKYPFASTVDTNNVLMSYLLTMHLIRLKHRKIVFINYKDGFTVTGDRQKGYEQALKEAGIPIDPELIYHEDVSEECGYNCIESLFTKNIQFSAVLVGMPQVARGVYSALTGKGLLIGRDVSVASLNVDKSGLTPALTAVNVDYVKHGNVAMDVLQELMVNKPEKPVRKIIDTEIIYTDSCQPHTN